MQLQRLVFNSGGGAANRLAQKQRGDGLAFRTVPVSNQLSNF
jgi:hypothetical protein